MGIGYMLLSLVQCVANILRLKDRKSVCRERVLVAV